MPSPRAHHYLPPVCSIAACQRASQHCCFRLYAGALKALKSVLSLEKGAQGLCLNLRSQLAAPDCCTLPCLLCSVRWALWTICYAAGAHWSPYRQRDVEGLDL